MPQGVDVTNTMITKTTPRENKRKHGREENQHAPINIAESAVKKRGAKRYDKSWWIYVSESVGIVPS